MATNSVNSITDATHDQTVAEPMQAVSAAWASTIPSGTHSDVALSKTRYVMALPEDSAVILAADGQWGSLEGCITVYVALPKDKPVSFAVVASVSPLDANAIFENAELVGQINSELYGAAASFFVFRDWPGIDAPTVAEIDSKLQDAKAAVQLLQSVDEVLGVTATLTRSGVGLSVEVDLSDSASDSTDTLLKRLNAVNHMSDTASITSLTLTCVVSGEAAVAGPSFSTVTFTSSVNVLPIFNGALLKDISLSLSITFRSDPTIPPYPFLLLTGELVLAIFDPQNPWTSKAFLTFDKLTETASLTVEPAPDQVQSMVDLGAIKLGNLNLHATYTFGQPSPTCSASLTLDVTLGTNVLHGTVTFGSSSTQPSASGLYFGITGTLDVSDLFHAILPNDCPNNLPELSFTDLNFTYSWKPTSFTATALADVLGVKFDAVVKFNASGTTGKGIYASGQVLGPIDLAIVSLYAANDPNSGPLVVYDSTKPGTEALTIAAGLTILGHPFPALNIVYTKSAQDQQSCLQVSLVLDSAAFPGGSVTLNLEFVEVDGTTRVRLNGVPLSGIKDAITSKKIFDKIRELTKKDPCKAIDIPLDDILTSTFSPKVEFSKSQPTPKLGQPLQCSFDISCMWTLSLLNEKSVVVDMKPFPLVMTVPQSWEDLLTQIGVAIDNSADSIVQDLLNNVDKFSEILAFYATKYAAQKWMSAALSAWLCRHPKAPGLTPIPASPVRTPKSNPSPPSSPVILPIPSSAGGSGSSSSAGNLAKISSAGAEADADASTATEAATVLGDIAEGLELGSILAL